MTETVTPPVGFRIASSRPDYAVSEAGGVFNLRTGEFMFADPGTHVITGREERPGYVRTFIIDIETLRAEVFPEANPLETTAIASPTLTGPRPTLFNHGERDHISSPSCSTCYLGFEATPEELRRMLWLMAVEFSEEVDATASELLDQIHERVVMGGINHEDAN